MVEIVLELRLTQFKAYIYNSKNMLQLGFIKIQLKLLSNRKILITLIEYTINW